MLLALVLLLAQEGLPDVPPRMPIDEEPSAAACTFPIALRGDNCAYEAGSAPADPIDNAAAASDAGRQACAKAARGDNGLRKECENAVVEASASHQCAIHARLVDPRGRLTRDSQECVELLRQEISRTSRAATLSTNCCSCLAESRCSVGATQCKRELADLAPSAALRSCLSRSCSDACSFAAPTRPLPEDSPAAVPDDPRKPKKI
ncbi:MAG TPA: hypothetical protein VEP66_11405 [Myxococcales bacterium]|nr:hypothetical protein [Myxococcales bacterium]